MVNEVPPSPPGPPNGPPRAPCGQLFKGFKFNVKTGECEDSGYVGCDPPRNLLASKMECESVCSPSEPGI